MARRGLAVEKLKICFWDTNDQDEKKKLVTEKMSKFLKNAASNTQYLIKSKGTVDEDNYPGVLSKKQRN